MPLGSSSEAPVTTPGPRSPSKCLILETTTPEVLPSPAIGGDGDVPPPSAVSAIVSSIRFLSARVLQMKPRNCRRLPPRPLLPGQSSFRLSRLMLPVPNAGERSRRPTPLYGTEPAEDIAK